MKRHALRICSPRSLAVAIRLSLMALSVSRRAALMLAFAGMAHGQATVDIEDTIVSGSPPAPVSGLLVITWSAFVSADSFGINSGRKEILLLPTPAAPSVAQAGTAGAITYYYWVSARTANSESLLSAAGSTATSHATLSVTNYNQITWTGVSGAADYRVWRTTGATAPTGTGSYLVGVATGATINDQSNSLSSATVPATAIDVALVPNAGSTPSGTSYRAEYYMPGQHFFETWVVGAPTGPYTIADVRVSEPPAPITTINASQVTAGTLASARLAAVQKRRTCMIVLGADDAAQPLEDGNLAAQQNQCFLYAAGTVIELLVSADDGTPSVTVARNRAGTLANLTAAPLQTGAAGALACANTAGSGLALDGVTTCTVALQNAAVLAGDWMDLNGGVAGGVAKRLSLAVTFLLD